MFSFLGHTNELNNQNKGSTVSSRSPSNLHQSKEEEVEGTDYYDPGTPLPSPDETSEDNKQQRSHSNHHGNDEDGEDDSHNHHDGKGGGGDGGGKNWWKDYFPHHGTWDDPNEVHGDAQMINHIPWNAMFPKNSYLPDDHLLDHQHHSHMGNKFHKTYDTHNPKEHQSHLGDTTGNAEGEGGRSHGGDTADYPEDFLVNHDQHSPYGHNTPYLGGETIHKGDKDIFGSVHGNLCVEKRDGICTGNHVLSIN